MEADSHGYSEPRPKIWHPDVVPWWISTYVNATVDDAKSQRVHLWETKDHVELGKINIDELQCECMHWMVSRSGTVALYECKSNSAVNVAQLSPIDLIMPSVTVNPVWQNTLHVSKLPWPTLRLQPLPWDALAVEIKSIDCAVVHQLDSQQVDKQIRTVRIRAQGTGLRNVALADCSAVIGKDAILESYQSSNDMIELVYRVPIESELKPGNIIFDDWRYRNRREYPVNQVKCAVESDAAASMLADYAFLARGLLEEAYASDDRISSPLLRTLIEIDTLLAQDIALDERVGVFTPLEKILADLVPTLRSLKSKEAATAADIELALAQLGSRFALAFDAVQKRVDQIVRAILELNIEFASRLEKLGSIIRWIWLPDRSLHYYSPTRSARSAESDDNSVRKALTYGLSVPFRVVGTAFSWVSLFGQSSTRFHYYRLLLLLAANLGVKADRLKSASCAVLEIEIAKTLEVLAWTTQDEITSNCAFAPFEDSGQTSLQAQSKESQQRAARCMLVIANLVQMKRLFLEDIYVGVVGRQNAGKSFLSGRLIEGVLGGAAAPQASTSKHTCFPQRYPLGSEKLPFKLVDYPGWGGSGEVEALSRLLMAACTHFVCVLDLTNINETTSKQLVAEACRLVTCVDETHLMVCGNKADSRLEAMERDGELTSDIATRACELLKDEIIAAYSLPKDAGLAHVVCFWYKSGSPDERLLVSRGGSSLLTIKQWIMRAVATAASDRLKYKALSRPCTSPDEPVSGSGCRILSFDGGGSRGLFTLQYLKLLEQCTGKKAWQLFDLIIGTSTGAILAVALGKFHLALEDLEQLYENLSAEVFKSRLPLLGYNHEVLESYLKKHFGERRMSQDEKNWPKVCVIAQEVVSLDGSEAYRPFAFRSYTVQRELPDILVGSSDFLYWEAVRASSAAPTFFSEFKCARSQRVWVDGGLGANNPSAIGLSEARALGFSGVAYFVSLGTGFKPAMYQQASSVSSYLRSFVATLRRMASSLTATEPTHDLLIKLSRDPASPFKYWRFNCHLSEDIPLDCIGEKLITAAKSVLKFAERRFKTALEEFAVLSFVSRLHLTRYR